MVIREFLKKLKSRRGFTLVEAATVVVITGALAAVAVPLASDKIEDAKIATASATTKAIATAMVRFLGDAKEWPAAKTFSDTGSAIVAIYDALRSGKDVDDILLDPVDDTGTWPIKDENGNPDTTRVDSMNKHLVSDSPTVTNLPPRHTYFNAGFNWIGPYIPVIDQDQWGKNYVAYVKAMREGRITKSSGQVVRIYGWIISAGGNQRIETPTTSPSIQGDDVGTLVFSATRIEGVNDRTTNGMSAK